MRIVVLKLRIRLCYGGRCVESVGIASTGFVGRDPEITLPQDMARELLGDRPSVVLVEKMLADGTRSVLARTNEPLDLYIVTDDRVEGPAKVYAYIVRGRFILLNDSALSKLGIVIIDPLTGVWCFRDELGKKERKGL